MRFSTVYQLAALRALRVRVCDCSRLYRNQRFDRLSRVDRGGLDSARQVVAARKSRDLRLIALPTSYGGSTTPALGNSGQMFAHLSH
jgi:hypothetical protein